MSEEIVEPWPENAGQDLVINAPCAAASAVAPMHDTELKEAGDGLD